EDRASDDRHDGPAVERRTRTLAGDATPRGADDQRLEREEDRDDGGGGVSQRAEVRNLMDREQHAAEARRAPRERAVLPEPPRDEEDGETEEQAVERDEQE